MTLPILMTKKILTLSKKICCTLADDLLANLPTPSLRFDFNSVQQYYVKILKYPDSCLSYLNNKIATGFESGLYTSMILIGLQKAFDTVNNDILLKKMELIALSEETAKWFKSYLPNRKFKVHIKNTFSELRNLLYGVSQGSILGPLLFLLYINDVDC